MRTRTRLMGLKKWLYEELCEGRNMKAPAPNMDIGKIERKEPKVYLGWAPARLDKTGLLQEDAASVCPGIIVMPNQAYVKYMEEKRFDRYNNVHRPPDMGQHFSCSILFSVYEPGVRLPGFIDSMDEKGGGLDLSLIKEGTEEGLFTLTDWMDDCMEKLLRDKSIPKTDLILPDNVMPGLTYSMYTDQNYVVDRRPIYYGFVNVDFACYAETGVNSEIRRLID